MSYCRRLFTVSTPEKIPGGRVWLLIGFWSAAGLPAAAQAQAVPVTIERSGERFELQRGGEPYFIKGAVLGRGYMPSLIQAGGNSARAGLRELDDAAAAGLTVLVNLPLGKPRSGFDYRDEVKVREQLKRTRELVRANKDHPAVLMWSLGNEPEIRTTEEERRLVWRAVNDLARVVHQEDGKHPVMTVVGGQYKTMLHEIVALCPDLDLIGLNAYADMLTLPEDIAKEGWSKAYVVTEFGPRGHWQAPRTAWRVPIEQTSTEKAAYYEAAYRKAVAGQPACLGSYVFYWTHKQEKTHTWYGLFLPDGGRTGAVDTMQRLWTGKWPENRCPEIAGGADAIKIELEGKADGVVSSAVVHPGDRLRCRVRVSDPDSESVKITWDLRVDVADNPNVGGDYEPPTKPIAGAVLSSSGEEALIEVPQQPGKYRIFVYARDDHEGAATANRPILAERTGG